MNLDYEKGKSETPRGHAILYFRNNSDPEDIWATYVIILPITVDVSKYVPPFLIDQVNHLGPNDLSAFAFPPAPERMQSFDSLTEIAMNREDDILYCGTLDSNDIPSTMIKINEIVQEYASQYARLNKNDSVSNELTSEESELGVNEVLYSLMSDDDKLSELTKLVGRLQFALEGGDLTQVAEAEQDVKILAGHFPGDHQINELIKAVKTKGDKGTKLAELYLKRCFNLVKENYMKIAEIEEQLTSVKNDNNQT